MKLVRGVLRSISLGLSPRFQQLQLVRALFTSPVSGTNASKSQDDFESPIFGDFPARDQRSTPSFKTLTCLGLGRAHDISFMGSKLNASSRSEFSDGLDERFSTLSDGMDEKLKQAAYNLEVDSEEVERDDYAFRPDSTFHPGNTYEPKDLDLRRPAIHKTPPRYEFETTTREVLRKADFRNVRFLANFMTEAKVIIKRSKTKIKAKAQRKVAREIKTVRAFGLMPFTTMGTKHFVLGKTMEDLGGDYEYKTYDTQNFVDNEAP